MCVKYLDWREGPSTLDEQLKQIRKLKDLNNLINESKLNGEFLMHDGLIFKFLKNLRFLF